MTGGSILLERERELSRVADLVKSAGNGEGRVLLIDGEAGTGKSALIDAAIGQARDQGLVILRARAGVLERDFGFGVVRQLFEAELAGRSGKGAAELFAGAAQLAAPVFEAAAPTGDAADAALAAQHGLYWLTANLAAEAPLLIVVDDVHWADQASVRWLLYLTRRLEGLPVAVVAATRLGEPAAAETELAALRIESAIEVIALAPLSAAACDLLVDEAFDGEPDEAFRAACHSVTGGNPFFLRELVGAVADEGIEPSFQSTAMIEGLGRDRASGHILLRVSRLGEDARSVAGAVAVLGASATARRAGLLADLATEAVPPAIDVLVAGRVLADGELLDFVHPLVRSAVYEDLPAARRAEMHLRAARLLADDGATREAANHLLVAERSGDPWAVDLLLGAGCASRDSGGGDSAVKLLRRALDEPPNAERRAKVLLELGRTERINADPAASEHILQARALASGVEEIKQSSHELAYSLGLAGDADGGAAALDEAIAAISDSDPAAVMTIQIDLVSLLVNHDDTFARGAELLERLLPAAEPGGEHERALLGLDTWVRCESGSGTAAAMEEVGLRALGGTALFDEGGAESLALQVCLLGLTRADRLDVTVPLTDRMLEQSRRRGSVVGIAAVHVLRAQDAFWCGDVGALEQEAEAAVEFSLLAQTPFSFGAGLTLLVVAYTYQGRLDKADELLNTYGFGELDPPKFVLSRLVLLARSHLRLRQGRNDDALRDAQAALDRDRGRHPQALHLFSLPEVAPALHATGDDEQALAVAREYVDAATQWGSPCDLGRANRILGAIEGGEDGIARLREAVALLEGTTRRFEHAHALVDLGALMRRCGERAAAREPLGAGMEMAHRCGADALAARAREELGAAGARPRALVRSGVEALSASERRVADLAATGASNPEIAQALFVSRRTVEAHLRSIFRKLDIRSRDELADALGARQPV